MNNKMITFSVTLLMIFLSLISFEYADKPVLNSGVEKENSALTREINSIDPEPTCICAEFRIGGVCSGRTTRFCEGPATCSSDLCGSSSEPGEN